MGAYAELLPFADTDHQRRVLKAAEEAGSASKAAKLLGLHKSGVCRTIERVKRTASQRGHSPDCDMQRIVPEGYHVRGVSTMYDGDGNIRAQWVKSQIDRDAREARLLEALHEVCEGMRGKCPAIRPPKQSTDDLLTLYPLGDPHIGLYAWSDEVGADFDLKIAETNLRAVVDELVRQAPASERAILLNLGDFFHTDNARNMTMRSGHTLDVDTRWAKILAVGVRVMIHAAERLLEKHKSVEIVNLIGNHDDHSAVMLSIALGLYFDGHDRVTVDQSPAQFRYREFGRTLLGFTHGHLRGKPDLGGIMATDAPEAWGRTRFRYWHLGHVHHDSMKDAWKDLHGCKVETHRTLAPADAYAHAEGYRSERDMKAITFHREYGEVSRQTVNLAMVG